MKYPKYEDKLREEVKKKGWKEMIVSYKEDEAEEFLTQKVNVSKFTTLENIWGDDRYQRYGWSFSELGISSSFIDLTIQDEKEDSIVLKGNFIVIANEYTNKYFLGSPTTKIKLTKAI